MRHFFAVVASLALVFACKPSSTESAAAPESVKVAELVAPSTAPASTVPANATDPADWNLVWEEEFNGDKLDLTRWRVDDSVDGLGNSQNVPENVKVRDGKLILIADQKNAKGLYPSGAIDTHDRVAWKQGRFEARIKIPPGKGIWPAFWMMPNVPRFEPFPKSGEIDIMEYIGREPYSAQGTIHFVGQEYNRDVGYWKSPTPIAGEWHVYGVDWGPNYFAWTVDGKEYHRTTLEQFRKFPFNRPFFVILNLAVGGKWALAPDENTKFPAEMEVDWVRVYQRKTK